MAFSLDIQTTLSHHQQAIDTALRQAMSIKSDIIPPQSDIVLEPFYGQMQYQLGWVDGNLAPTIAHPGKLLRPTLLLLAYEISGAWGLVNDTTISPDQTPAYLRRALFAAAAIELTHNCTLIHDDIEDGDKERRHRPTVWNLWGIPHATNTGDGMFTLARLTLWRALDEGVEREIAARLSTLLDRTCLAIFAGQDLDMSFEQRLDISHSMYLNMIHRKTAALMACASEMGAHLGTCDAETIRSLRRFGWVLGTAFQARDDLFGVWEAEELGKSPAGDLYRRKKTVHTKPLKQSLPFLLNHSHPKLWSSARCWLAFCIAVCRSETPGGIPARYSCSCSGGVAWTGRLIRLKSHPHLLWQAMCGAPVRCKKRTSASTLRNAA